MAVSLHYWLSFHTFPISDENSPAKKHNVKYTSLISEQGASENHTKIHRIIIIICISFKWSILLNLKPANILWFTVINCVQQEFFFTEGAVALPQAFLSLYTIHNQSALL